MIAPIRTPVILAPAFRTNVEATAAGEPQPCGVTTVATIWYRIPGTGGPVTLNTVGSEIACNNDIWAGGNAQDDRASELVFNTQEGVEYFAADPPPDRDGDGLWVPSRRSTRVQVLAVNALPKGATVKVTCSSKPRRRCPRSRTYRIRKATKKLNVRKPFRSKRLPAGARVTIVITAPGYEGKVYVYRMRKQKRPSLRQLCLPPGATRPGTCL